MLESAAKYNSTCFCPPPSPFSSKPADTDVTVFVYSSSTTMALGTSWMKNIPACRILQLQVVICTLAGGGEPFLGQLSKQTNRAFSCVWGSNFGLYFYTLSHTFLWHWKTWLITRVVFVVRDLKDEMAEWNIVEYNVPKVGWRAPTTLSGLKVSVLHVLWNSEMASSRLFHAFSRLSFRSSFPLGKRILSAQNISFWRQLHRWELMLQERGRSASVCMSARENNSGQKKGTRYSSLHG